MKKVSNGKLYKILRPLFSIIFRLYYNPQIENKGYIPKSGPALVAGNHKHAMDPIFVGVCTRRVLHSLAKKELHDGILGFFFRAVGTVPVDLHAESNKEATAAVIEVLNNGGLIGISPEAKRNYTQELLLPFKFGAVSTAKRTKSVIVPYAITGNYKFRSKNLKIVFGESIDVSNMDLEDANKCLYEKVKELLVLSLKGGNGNERNGS